MHGILALLRLPFGCPTASTGKSVHWHDWQSQGPGQCSLVWSLHHSHQLALAETALSTCTPLQQHILLQGRLSILAIKTHTFFMPCSQALLKQGHDSAAGCSSIPEDGVGPQKVLEAGRPLPVARVQQQILAHRLQLCPHPLEVPIKHPAQNSVACSQTHTSCVSWSSL